MYFRMTASFHTGNRPATLTENDPEISHNFLIIITYHPALHNTCDENSKSFAPSLSRVSVLSFRNTTVRCRFRRLPVATMPQAARRCLCDGNS